MLAERSKGLQAVDWHESIAPGGAGCARRLRAWAKLPAAAAALDLARLRRLAEEWPADGWHRSETAAAYRLALLRGVVNGHFLRRASWRGRLKAKKEREGRSRCRPR